MAFDRKKKVDPRLLGANPWLDNPEKGLSLIASLLAAPARDIEDAPGLDKMIGHCGRLLSAEMEDNFAAMRQIIKLFSLPGRNRLLRNTAIAGFGGGFSSGKSSVLNSLLSDDVKYKLPVSSSPTTSISTYIMRGNAEKAVACSVTGREVSLDPDALEAISHQFRAKHGISLAQYIEFVGLSLPQFPCSDVSLLDTPGYNKADTATMQQHHDKMRSINALSSVDHLVWVIDAQQPVLTGTDANFINDLELSGEITVILNKCDMYGDIFQNPNPENDARVESVRQSLKKQNVPYTAVIPYSASMPDWNNGRAKIISFLEKLAKGKKSGQERVAQMDAIVRQIQDMFKAGHEYYHKDELAKIDACMEASINPLELASMAQMRGLIGFERAALASDGKFFDMSAAELRKWIKGQMEAASA